MNHRIPTHTTLMVALALVGPLMQSGYAQSPRIGGAIEQKAPDSRPATIDTAPGSMQLMMPGEAHSIFAKMTGRWSGKLKIWNPATPKLPPLESTEDSETRVILGGRFVIEESRGSIMNMPLQRMSILGYDNYKKVYTLVFYSTFETATNMATGSFDASGNVLTLRGVFDEVQGKTPFKNVIRIVSDDVHIFESYMILPDGKELKVIEETVTRVK